MQEASPLPNNNSQAMPAAEFREPSADGPGLRRSGRVRTEVAMPDYDASSDATEGKLLLYPIQRKTEVTSCHMKYDESLSFSYPELSMSSTAGFAQRQSSRCPDLISVCSMKFQMRKALHMRARSFLNLVIVMPTKC